MKNIKNSQLIYIIDLINEIIKWGGSWDYSILIDEDYKITRAIIEKIYLTILNLDKPFYSNEEAAEISFTTEEIKVLEQLVNESKNHDIEAIASLYKKLHVSTGE